MSSVIGTSSFTVVVLPDFTGVKAFAVSRSITLRSSSGKVAERVERRAVALAVVAVGLLDLDRAVSGVEVVQRLDVVEEHVVELDGVNTAVVLRARIVTGLLWPLGFANAIFSRPSVVVDSCAATFDEMNAKPFGSTTPSR